jgi:hypothetical protein
MRCCDMSMQKTLGDATRRHSRVWRKVGLISSLSIAHSWTTNSFVHRHRHDRTPSSQRSGEISAHRM